MQRPLTLSKAQLSKLKKASWSEWIQVFNKIHNPQLYTSVGIVSVRTKDEKKQTF